MLNRLFRRRSKKTSKFRIAGLCEGNPRVTVDSPHKGSVTRKCIHLTTSCHECTTRSQSVYVSSSASLTLRNPVNREAVIKRFAWHVRLTLLTQIYSGCRNGCTFCKIDMFGFHGVMIRQVNMVKSPCIDNSLIYGKLLFWDSSLINIFCSSFWVTYHWLKTMSNAFCVDKNEWSVASEVLIKPFHIWFVLKH